jgi:hypothetical protein
LEEEAHGFNKWQLGLSLYRDVGINSTLLQQHTGWQPAGALLEHVSDLGLKGLGFQEPGNDNATSKWGRQEGLPIEFGTPRH